MCIILACMHSSIDIMQDRLDFSSIYVIRQLLQLYASHTVHSSKKNASQYILPLLDDFVGNHWANHRCLKWKNVTKVFWRLYDNDKAILDGQFLDKKVEISETQKLIFTLTSCGQCHKTISLQRNASLYYEIMHNG